MTELMKRLAEAIKDRQPEGSNLSTDEAAGMVEAVLQGLHDITMDRAEESIHEAQVHRYTTIAVHRVLLGGRLSD